MVAKAKEAQHQRSEREEEAKSSVRVSRLGEKGKSEVMFDFDENESEEREQD